MAIGRIPEPGTGIPESIVDAKGDIVTATAADTPARLAVGTNDHRLVAASGEATGLKYVADTQNTVVDAKGDLLVGTAADTIARLAVGTNGHTLVADSAETTGLKWQAASSGALTLIKTAAFSSVADTGTTFNTVFSSTYEYYILQLSVKGSTTANLLFQIRSGSTTRTANYYGSSAFVAPSSSTLTNSGSNGTSSWDLMDIGSAYESIASLTLNYRQTTLPFISGTFNSIISNTTGFCGLLVDNGSFDGFILSASTGNITGSVSVYGLAKS